MTSSQDKYDEMLRNPTVSRRWGSVAKSDLEEILQTSSTLTPMEIALKLHEKRPHYRFSVKMVTEQINSMRPGVIGGLHETIPNNSASAPRSAPAPAPPVGPMLRIATRSGRKNWQGIRDESDSRSLVGTIGASLAAKQGKSHRPLLMPTFEHVTLGTVGQAAIPHQSIIRDDIAMAEGLGDEDYEPAQLSSPPRGAAPSSSSRSPGASRPSPSSIDKEAGAPAQKKPCLNPIGGSDPNDQVLDLSNVTEPSGSLAPSIFWALQSTKLLVMCLTDNGVNVAVQWPPKSPSLPVKLQFQRALTLPTEQVEERFQPAFLSWEGDSTLQWPLYVIPPFPLKTLRPPNKVVIPGSPQMVVYTFELSQAWTSNSIDLTHTSPYQYI
jgi:hypothetical protein